MQDKRPKNDKGQPHGLWEMYFSDGANWCVGKYINGVKCGKFVLNHPSGEIHQTLYCVLL